MRSVKHSNYSNRVSRHNGQFVGYIIEIYLIRYFLVANISCINLKFDQHIESTHTQLPCPRQLMEF